MGKEQEEIVFSDFIEIIGYYYEENPFQSDKLKKIFLPGSIKEIHGDFLTGMDVKVIQLDTTPKYDIRIKAQWGVGQMYVPYGYEDAYRGLEHETVKLYPDIKSANITYVYDHPDLITDEVPNNGVCFVDHIEQGEKIKAIPEIP